MQQVIFRIPIHTPWTPDGIPLYGFGAMLFLAFVCGAWVASRRGRLVGIPPDRMEVLLLWLFAIGLVGGRVLYFLAEVNPGERNWLRFFNVWEGGIVFYGGAIGGAIAAVLAYWKLLRPLKISPWRVADAIAPGVAVGLFFGRLGCFLNGCCWGYVAPPDVAAAHFPALSAPAREQLVVELGHQTLAGFAMDEAAPDRRTVAAVESGSPADRAGLRAGDVIVGVNGRDVPTEAAFERLLQSGLERGASVLELAVRRGGREVDIAGFTPRLIGLYPTQLYESISAALLFLALVATWPVRRYDGQVLVLLMIGYAVHRFVNESLRDDTAPFGPLTLSQWISVGIFGGGVLIAAIRRVQISAATTTGSPANRP